MEQIQEIANQNGTPHLQICPIFKNLGNLLFTSSKPKYEKRKKIGSKGNRNLVLNPGHNNMGIINVAKNRLTKISFLGGFVKKQNIPRSAAVGPHSQRRETKNFDQTFKQFCAYFSTSEKTHSSSSIQKIPSFESVKFNFPNTPPK